ncbi:probable ubiquitin-conjugating enzyme E2 25 [Solanum pennellii]|uniref:Probable ubiquitin-conjugating enzyme E2 25 n=1 Tax=Solanum pennellii TaxID=28526 RepID=A0ABM1GJQ0_SOLPN|nr:probable ubiquitin-conjugating enzyme E2 25 [Solanum pennellii]
MDEANNNMYGEIEEIIDDIEQRFNQINKFSILYYPPDDHHFLKYDRNSKNMGLDSAFRQRIKKEWLLLEKKLPSSIVVKSYEKRIDLMRTVIVGPPDTPYAYGLFFFDILFPRNYPNCPPRIHYHSYQLDLNEFLDPKGKVILSLLENGNIVSNWYCGVQGKWNPHKSNILQVLTAIQTSILSTTRVNPCGREGYKNAFTSTCKGMICMLKEPLMNFRDFVAGYFRTRAHHILLNYKKQMDDSDSMVDLFHELYRAFEQNGTYCKHHILVDLPAEEKIKQPRVC